MHQKRHQPLHQVQPLQQPQQPLPRHTSVNRHGVVVALEDDDLDLLQVRSFIAQWDFRSKVLPLPLFLFYKQRFFQGVEIQENISNSTPYFQSAKQRLEICLATKNQSLSNKTYEKFAACLHIQVQFQTF